MKKMESVRDLSNHERPVHAPATIEAIKKVKPGEKLAQYGISYGTNYRRLQLTKPSWTVTATCYTDLIHPTEDRLLTVRELARLQTFPDNYAFCGPRRGGAGKRLVAHVFAQVGNAVPPKLAEVVARHIRARLFPKRTSITAVSLFTGAGGLDIGFERSGFEIVACLESDSYAVQTLRRNQINGYHLGASIVQESAFDVVIEDLIDGRADIVIGGPPCQSFSHAGTREGRNDHRGLLIEEFARIALEARPMVVVLENVPGLLTADKGAVVNAYIQIMENAGFRVEQWILAAEEYGVPQRRKRCFLVAHKSRISPGPPKATHGSNSLISQGLLPVINVGEALAGLPPPSPPSASAIAVAATISDRKAKQDKTLWLKRSFDIPPHVRDVITTKLRDANLSNDILMDASQWELLVLYEVLDCSPIRITVDRALSRFAKRFLLPFPEKAQDAVYHLGVKALERRGILHDTVSAASALRLVNGTVTG